MIKKIQARLHWICSQEISNLKRHASNRDPKHLFSISAWVTFQDIVTLSMESEEKNLKLKELQLGNAEALAEVYQSYRAEFLQWMMSNFGCVEQDAKDIYQNTILTFSEKIRNEQISNLNSSLKSYIFGIGKKKFLEHRRSTYRQRRIQDPTMGPEEATEVDKREYEAQLELVEHSLELLGEPCRSLLELYYFHNMSMDEISAQLRYKNRNTTKNLKYKCMLRLQKIFKNEWQKKQNEL